MHGPERTGKMALVGETCRNGGLSEAEPLFDQGAGATQSPVADIGCRRQANRFLEIPDDLEPGDARGVGKPLQVELRAKVAFDKVLVEREPLSRSRAFDLLYPPAAIAMPNDEMPQCDEQRRLGLRRVR